MKRTAILLGLIATAGPTGAACRLDAAVPDRPLVELYSSEGCSSCPPADRWLLEQGGGGAVVGLAFHVDYWDSLGWPDRFAQAAFGTRQQQRVGATGSTAVYTPQVMVGGNSQVHWYSPGEVRRALPSVAKLDDGLRYTLATASTGDRVQIDLATAPAAAERAPRRVYLAVFSDGLSSKVRSGENSGHTLEHSRVVRSLYGPWPTVGGVVTQSIDYALPTERGARMGVVAFSEDGRGVPAGAVELGLDQACAVPN